MNNESQNIEYKLTWRDEYLKWVCGFANAQGGTIYIGIDDKGDAFESYGLKPPQFEFTCGGLNTIIYRNEKFAEEQDAANAVENDFTINQNGNGLIENLLTINQNRQELIEKLIANASNTGIKLTENRISILQMIIDNPQITKSEMAQAIGISETSISKNIEAMRGTYLERIGADKNGYWKIIEQ